MGYTHYWGFKDETLKQEDFDKIVKDVKVIEKYFKENDIVSRNAGGYHKDNFAKLDKNSVSYRGWIVGKEIEEIEAISVNGDKEKELDHENLYIQVGENTWTFCKTARKPYDLIVTLILLSVKFHTRSTRVSSDGENEDWQHAFELFNVIFPKRNTFFNFKEYVSGSKTLDGSLQILNRKKVSEKLLTTGERV
jgi:hypothetical protein